VHPGRGGECGSQGGSINNNIWSHRFSLSDLTGRDFETKELTKDGRKIRVDDYVVVPALACDGRSMIEIGVFAHEFGHAFGLPDLYDTKKPARTQGVGNWDLMGAGSWGGDDKSPQRPAHMSAWSRIFLGWAQPKVITSDAKGVQLRPMEKVPEV
jgi:M6 family metalloprotease-like protein